MTIRDRGAIHNKAQESLANAKGDPKKILLIYLGIVTALSVVVAVFSVVLSNRIDETGGLSNMGLRSVLSRRTYVDDGIRVRSENDKLVVDLHISVIYGMNISAIAKSIVHKVRYTVEEATGMSVKKVNVYVDGMKPE